MCIVSADFSFFSRLHASISLLILLSTYISTKWAKYAGISRWAAKKIQARLAAFVFQSAAMFTSATDSMCLRNVP